MSRKKTRLCPPNSPDIGGVTALRTDERACSLLARGIDAWFPMDWILHAPLIRGAAVQSGPGSGLSPLPRSLLACLQTGLPVLLETAVPDPRDPHPPVLDRDRLGSDAALSRQLGLEE